MANLKPFITILRRSLKSKYPKIVMNNRMLMNCYTVDEDSDVGMHYILHIPDTPDYLDEFYDSTLILDVKELLSAYTVGHKVLTEKKRELKAKPKEVREEFYFSSHKKDASVKMLFFVQDEIVDTQVVALQWPVTDSDPMLFNIEKTYYDMINRIKPGGVGLIFDGVKTNLYNLAIDSPQIYFYKVKIGSKKVKLPLYKSLFIGKKDWDEFFVSIQETIIDQVYLYVVHFTNDDITEQFIGYVQNF